MRFVSSTATNCHSECTAFKTLPVMVVANGELTVVHLKMHKLSRKAWEALIPRKACMSTTSRTEWKAAESTYKNNCMLSTAAVLLAAKSTEGPQCGSSNTQGTINFKRTSRTAIQVSTTQWYSWQCRHLWQTPSKVISQVSPETMRCVASDTVAPSEAHLLQQACMTPWWEERGHCCSIEGSSQTDLWQFNH